MTRTMWTDEQLSAFLDGELPPQEMDALARDLETDEALAARMESLGGANQAYIAAVDAIAGRPVKAGLAEAMKTPPTAKVIAFRPRSIPAFLMEHRAIAASLLCAVAVWGVTSSAMGPQSADPFAPGPDGIIVAGSPLHRALETAPTGEVITVSGNTAVTPRLTFASADGGFCRQFDMVTADGASAAIACREDGGWRTQIAAYGLPRPTGDFQTASAARSPALEAFIDQHISGSPMTTEEEARLLSDAWKAGGQ